MQNSCKIFSKTLGLFRKLPKRKTTANAVVSMVFEILLVNIRNKRTEKVGVEP